MIEWREHGHRTDPTSHLLAGTAGSLYINVRTKHPSHPGGWTMDCKQVGLDAIKLSAISAIEARIQAAEIVRERLRGWLEAIGG